MIRLYPGRKLSALPFLKDVFLSLGRAGFTLSEILLAAAIMAFAFAAILSLFISCMVINDSSRNLSVAAGHAQFAVEELRNTSFEAIVDDTWGTEDIEAKGLSVIKGEEIIIEADSEAADLLNITVTVNWQDWLGSQRQIQISTLLEDTLAEAIAAEGDDDEEDDGDDDDEDDDD